MIGKEGGTAKPALAWSALGVLAVAVSVSVPLPYSVTASGIVFPSARWALTKGTDGQLVGNLFNYATGLSEGFSVTHFARGEAVRIEIHPAVAAFGRVAVGDTVASVYSTEAEERLAELTGELSVAQAALASGSAGEKEPLVEGLEHQLDRATAAATHQHRELDRISRLFEEKLIPQQEYEGAQSAADLADAEVAIARSQLQAAKSGEKPEEIQLHRSNIDALSRQINVLENRLSSFTITSPLEGTVSRGMSPDTLLVVSDARSLVLLIPVSWEEYEYASKARQVTVEFQGSSKGTTAELESFQPEVHLIGGEPAVAATALVPEAPVGLVPGMVTRCVIHCEPLTILERLKRLVLSARL
jgi:hypothetical protein